MRTALFRAAAFTVAFGSLAAAAALAPTPAFARNAQAANPASAFVNDNIHKGLEILNNKSLSVEQRRVQFEGFFLGLTDMNRIAAFTLGQYRRGASQADQDAFGNAFQNYAVAVYQSYFAKYAGQTLRVMNSQERAPGDFIVTTEMNSPNDRTGQPLEVDFRVRTDGPKPVVVDMSVAGIWLAIEERDQFTSFLGQNNGDIKLLIQYLSDLAKQFK